MYLLKMTTFDQIVYLKVNIIDFGNISTTVKQVLYRVLNRLD